MIPIATYKTHLLVGFPQYGDSAQVVGRWEWVPSSVEILATIGGANKIFKGFVLVAPVGGIYLGNYMAPEPDFGACG